MPLVTCPDCKESISDAAPACIHCGRPSRRHAASPEPVAAMENLFASIPFFAEPGMGTTTITINNGGRPSCPSCGSLAVQTLDIVWRKGQGRSVRGHIHGDFDGDGDREYATTHTTLSEQTAESKAAEPPGPRAAWAGALLVGISSLITLFFVAVSGPFGLFLGPPVLVWLSWRRWQKQRRYNREELPVLLERWRNSYRCQSCAHTFVDERGAARA